MNRKIKLRGALGVAVILFLVVGMSTFAERDDAISLGQMEIFSNDSVGGSWHMYTDTRDEFLTDNYGNEYEHSFYAGHGSVTYLTNYLYDTFSGTVAFPKGGSYDKSRNSATLIIYGDDEVLKKFEKFNNLSSPEAFCLNIESYERIKLEWSCEGLNIWENWGYYATIFDGEFTSDLLYGPLDCEGLDGEYDVPYDYSAMGCWYCVTNDYEQGIAVRTAPSSESELICRLPYGTGFFSDQEKWEWAHTVVNGCGGWIDKDYISVIPDMYGQSFEVRSVSGSGSWYMITSDYSQGIAVRAEPSKDATLYCRIPYGTEFWVEALCGSWGFTTVNDWTGWINLDYAKEIYRDDMEESQGFYTFDYVVEPNEYILSDTAEEYLTEDGVGQLTQKGLCYARNEIYAKKGRKFQSKELQEYFNEKTWYNGIYEPGTDDSKVEVMLNQYERYNVQLLLRMEKRLGLYSLN